MKFFDWYFSPLAEYDLCLPYSEQKLRELLEKECVPTHFKIWSWHDLKAQFRVIKANWCMTGFPLFLIKKKGDKIMLYPVGKNSIRHEVCLTSQSVADSVETTLHIVIKVQGSSCFLFIFYTLLFLAIVGLCFLMCLGEVPILPVVFGVVMIPYSFFVLKRIRSMAENDLPLIRESLERLLEKGNKAT